VSRIGTVKILAEVLSYDKDMLSFFESFVFLLKDHLACEDQSMETCKGKGGNEKRKWVTDDSNSFSPVSIFFSLSPEWLSRALEIDQLVQLILYTKEPLFL
jgi:hypothetical protein